MNVLSSLKINSKPFKAKPANSISSKKKNASSVDAYNQFCKQYNVTKLIKAIEASTQLMTQLMHGKKKIDLSQKEDEQSS